MSCVITVIAELFWRVRPQDKLYDCFYIDSLRTISKAENRNRHCWGNHLSGSSPSLLKVVHTSFWSLYCHRVMHGKGGLSTHPGMHFACSERPLWTEVLYLGLTPAFTDYICCMFYRLLPSLEASLFSFWDKMLEFLRDGYLQGFPPF